MIHILVIDDDPFIGDLAEAVLSDDGRAISRSMTGAEGLERLTGEAPDLVLLDVGLPDVSGFEILRILRGAPGWDETRILMLTASHAMDDIVRAKQGGAAGYICKPVQPQALARMVTDVLADRDLIWVDDYTRARRTS